MPSASREGDCRTRFQPLFTFAQRPYLGGSQKQFGCTLSAEPPHSGLEGAFFENRDRLLRFVASRGGGDSTEDILQELWLKISSSNSGPVASPLSYLFRMADLLMIDRYRSARQAEKRDREWAEVNGAAALGVSDEPLPDRAIIARQHTQLVTQTLNALGQRPAAIFRRHRVDGISQRQVAEEFGVSLSTVESDLRAAYRALAGLKERIDEV